jgi:hypothetical protein
MMNWRNKWITAGAQSIDDFIKTYESLAAHFRQQKEWGITLYEDGGVEDDYATFITDDMETAVRAGFVLYSDENCEEGFLLTLEGEEVKIPAHILEKYKK